VNVCDFKTDLRECDCVTTWGLRRATTRNRANIPKVGRAIKRAKVLLQERGASVLEVGPRIGFREASSVATSFRKTTEASPTCYRRSAG
jgi:methylphosphotriester-DNA--protein-cysteine methyltransferase